MAKEQPKIFPEVDFGIVAFWVRVGRGRRKRRGQLFGRSNSSRHLFPPSDRQTPIGPVATVNPIQPRSNSSFRVRLASEGGASVLRGPPSGLLISCGAVLV